MKNKLRSLKTGQAFTAQAGGVGEGDDDAAELYHTKKKCNCGPKCDCPECASVKTNVLKLVKKDNEKKKNTRDYSDIGKPRKKKFNARIVK